MLKEERDGKFAIPFFMTYDYPTNRKQRQM